MLHITESNHLIRVCIAEYYSNLFELYCKKIRLSTKELTEEHGLSKCTPLHYAARYCQVDVIKEILETDGIDKQTLLEMKDSGGYTALHWASVFKQTGIAKLILETPGIDKRKLLEIQDQTGTTALHLAALTNNVEIIKAILEAPGIDKQKLLEIQEQNGYTALHIIAKNGNHGDVIKEILETPEIDKQKLLEMQRDNGDTALSCAVKGYRVNAVKILFEHQISTVGLRSSEKKAMNFLTPEDLREILKIEFSAELGEAGSTIRVEREALVLKAVHDHLKTYDTDQSWILMLGQLH